MKAPGALDSYGDPRNPDTICGLATPLGPGGIGVIRLSGTEALIVAERVFHGKHQPTTSQSHRILHGVFFDPGSAEDVDEVLLSIFKAPHSYTGEDIAEFSFHGSPTILARALSILRTQGLRLAGPGEFTFRAFCNGRIDLTQAEAVAELIAAKSEKAAAAAYRQLNGSLKDLIGRLRSGLIEALAWLEMSADFVEEDLEFKRVEEISGKFAEIIGQLAKLRESCQRSKLIRDGLTVTIIGAPNVGKSSIFNCLLARERSIVTTQPGTTRDTIDEYINLSGYPVRLIDTAGIRHTDDMVETIGIDRTIGSLTDSDVVFWVIDGAEGFSEGDESIRRLLRGQPAAALINKSDIADPEKIRDCRAKLGQARIFTVSAKTGSGLAAATRWLIDNYLELAGDRPEFPFIINQRHLAAIDQATEHLRLAGEAIARGESFEFVAFDGRKAADILGEITGETTPDDILNKIFGDFCIGK
jgi:tRNA modification GTPase